jgi:hypothetical protein
VLLFIYLFGAYHQLIWGKEEEEEEEIRPSLCVYDRFVFP